MTKLETIRKQKGFTREELSLLSGVHAQTIVAIEYGKTKYQSIKLGTLIALAKALKCKVGDIVPLAIAKKLR